MSISITFSPLSIPQANIQKPVGVDSGTSGNWTPAASTLTIQALQQLLQDLNTGKCTPQEAAEKLVAIIGDPQQPGQGGTLVHYMPDDLENEFNLLYSDLASGQPDINLFTKCINDLIADVPSPQLIACDMRIIETEIYKVYHSHGQLTQSQLDRIQMKLESEVGYDVDLLSPAGQNAYKALQQDLDIAIQTGAQDLPDMAHQLELLSSALDSVKSSDNTSCVTGNVPLAARLLSAQV